MIHLTYEISIDDLLGLSPVERKLLDESWRKMIEFDPFEPQEPTDRDIYDGPRYNFLE